MQVMIVGHGPSLKGAGKGSRIDAFDIVVRLKACVLGTEDYGSRIDALCLSTEVLGLAKQPSGMYWLYPKRGTYDRQAVGEMVGQAIGAVFLPFDLCNRWNDEFRKMGGRHPNVSTGLAAIIIAGHHLSPDQIVLAGFDTLLNPSVEFSRNDEIPRTGAGKIDHDWQTENKLLKIVADTYRFEIAAL